MISKSYLPSDTAIDLATSWELKRDSKSVVVFILKFPNCSLVVSKIKMQQKKESKENIPMAKEQVSHPECATKNGRITLVA